MFHLTCKRNLWELPEVPSFAVKTNARNYFPLCYQDPEIILPSSIQGCLSTGSPTTLEITGGPWKGLGDAVGLRGRHCNTLAAL